MKIAIFGGKGFLGTKLKKSFSEIGHVVLDITSKENFKYSVDATNFSGTLKFLEAEKPDIVIDTLALTSSVECERNPDLANKLNFITAKNISQASKKINAKFFFISSSYVFEGGKGDYSEEEVLSPQGIYAKTKILAEKEVLIKKNIVLRVDLLYGYNGKGLNNGILGNIISGKEILLGNVNQIRQPLLIDDLANIILSLVKDKQSGIFHVAGPDKISMLEFVKKLEKLVRKDSKISILEEKDLLVKPMKDTSLNISKINNLGTRTTGLEEGLKIIKNQLK